MSVYEPIIKDTCPKCENEIYSEGINNGVGYVYPPFHCECGWSEMCAFENKEDCKRCDQYEKCYKL